MNELLDFFKTKVSDLGIFKIDGESFDCVKLEEMLRAQALFEKKYIIVCDRVLEDLQARDFVKKNIEKFSSSPNIFLFLENDLEDDVLGLFKRHSQKAQEFKPLTGVKLKKWIQDNVSKISPAVQEEIIKICGPDLWCVSKEIEKYELSDSKGESFGRPKGLPFNPFAICDAVAEKNNIRAWMLFQQALTNGIDAEEIFWKIWWQIKSLLLVKKLQGLSLDGHKGQSLGANLEKETGLHPFVVKKNLSAIHNFSEEELQNYSFHLVKLYHDARRGLEEFPIGLEKFLLNI